MILDKTEILKISDSLNSEDIEKLSFAADIIKRGGTVCFPTETVYGLGANALNKDAVSEIFVAKGRPQDNPLIIHLHDADEINKYCNADNNEYFKKISNLFPAPLTVILEKKEMIPDVVTAKLKSVGVRIPKDKIARKFLELCNVPVAAPSANISGRPSPTCAEHVIEDLCGKVDAIICAGNTNVGLESTIVSLVTTPPTLLRPGGITYETLCDIFGEVAVSDAVLHEMKPGDTASAPGMKYKHYSPRTNVTLVIGNTEKASRFFKGKQDNEKCAILAFSEDIPFISKENVFDIGNECDHDKHAKCIFSYLRATDKIDGLENVYVHISADKTGLGLAVYNRLLKAAAYNIITL